MRFTFWAIGAPLLVLFLVFAIGGHDQLSRDLAWLAVPAGFWFWCGLPVAVVYWLVRLVRFAWSRPGARVER
jgi:hypothetical protein